MHRTENAKGGIVPATVNETLLSIEGKVGREVKITFKSQQDGFTGNDTRGILVKNNGIYFINGKNIPKNNIRNIQLL